MSVVSKALVVFTLLTLVACLPAAASTSFARDLGDATGPLVAVGIAATYLGSGDHARSNAARTADAAIIALGTAEIFKPNINVDDALHRHGFPSGHAAIAFAAATSLADIAPKHKWLYYAGAALIGWSRVESGAHSWGDVVGGAALGFGAGKWSMSSPDGLMLGKVYRF